jgi:hypothetical protein
LLPFPLCDSARNDADALCQRCLTHLGDSARMSNPVGQASGKLPIGSAPL